MRPQRDERDAGHRDTTQRGRTERCHAKRYCREGHRKRHHTQRNTHRKARTLDGGCNRILVYLVVKNGKVAQAFV